MSAPFDVYLLTGLSPPSNVKLTANTLGQGFTFSINLDGQTLPAFTLAQNTEIDFGITSADNVVAAFALTNSFSNSFSFAITLDPDIAAFSLQSGTANSFTFAAVPAPTSIFFDFTGLFHFPASPTIGQTVMAPNGFTYQWDGLKWMSVGGVYLPDAGGVMTGPLFLSGDPTVNLQAATKHYVDIV
jgi:hypothetical protein